jgi:hypothetical protein
MTWLDSGFKSKTADTHLHSRGTILPEACVSSSLKEKMEQGMPDARCTRGLVCKGHKEKRTFPQSNMQGGGPRQLSQITHLHKCRRQMPGSCFKMNLLRIETRPPGPDVCFGLKPDIRPEQFTLLQERLETVRDGQYSE